MSALTVAIVAYLVVLAGGLLFAGALCRTAAEAFRDDEPVRGEPESWAPEWEADWPQT